MKDPETSISLESIEFLFRHPLLFLCPFIIIMSLTFAYVSNISLYYVSTAVLSFESKAVGAVGVERQTQRNKEDVVGKLLFGQNIRGIINEAWPEVKEETSPRRYNNMLEGLRNPKSGIQIKPVSGDPSLLTISFLNADPDICYKVVKATVDTVIKANKEEVEKGMGTSLAFITNQLEFYKNKMAESERETARLKTELNELLPQLSDAEKALVREVSGETAGRQEVSAATQTAAKYDETLMELNLQLLEAQKKRKILEKGQLLPQAASVPTQQPVADTAIQEYDKAIAVKELEIVKLTSQGYMPEHPDVTRLESEMDMLKIVKEKRIKALTSETSVESTIGATQKEEMVKAQLQDVEFQIEALRDKINLIEQYKKTAKLQAPEIQNKTVSEKVARLLELRNEKGISLTYFSQLSKQKEDLEFKIRSEKSEVGFNIEVMEEPTVPLEPVPFQKTSKLFMGFLLALGVGASLSYITDSLGNSVKTAAELRELLQIPVLAAINRMTSPQETKARRKRRIIIAVSLAIFVLLSNILARWITGGPGPK